ncbi:hypothetical protein CVV38_03740 [Candidatus Peregrinibacteria bacterium HGW-Peregrinibacteria-1]|jgi:phosphatidylglycerol:prolipoprotein diacylglycerol transferase|nr:MAG: hypothetical protein CVV38_03740 [Candidatus Peregrinibacteria bacterium HGW-Peregrinibacteria-1]
MHQILFQTKYFNLTTLTVFTAIAIIVGAITIVKLSSLNSLKIQFLSDNFLMIAVVGVIFGRVVGIISHWSYYFADLDTGKLLQLLKLWDNNFSGIGALIGGLAFFVYICKKRQQDLFRWLDVITPSLVATMAIIHVGNFFQGSAYGKPTSLPWGVNFENPIIKYTVPIHPTQMYAFLYSVTILAILYFINKHPKISTSPAGTIALITVWLYSFFRFLEDFIRGDDTILILGIRLSHYISFIILAITTAIVVKTIKQLKNNSTN